MFRPIAATSGCSRVLVKSPLFSPRKIAHLGPNQPPQHLRSFANRAPSHRKPRPRMFQLTTERPDYTPSREDMPFVHFADSINRPKPKFKSPRKRASKLYHELKTGAIEASIAVKPAVFDLPFRVGDTIELEIQVDGKVSSPTPKLEKVRGILIGHEKRGISTSVRIIDVLHGETVERKIELHSPMVKSLKVLEERFITKGKKRVKRAKLYYLRDRPDNELRVTKE